MKICKHCGQTNYSMDWTCQCLDAQLIKAEEMLARTRQSNDFIIKELESRLQHLRSLKDGSNATLAAIHKIMP